MGYAASKFPSSEIAGWASAEVADAVSARAIAMSILNCGIADLRFRFRAKIDRLFGAVEFRT